MRYISFQETASFNLEAAEDDTLVGAMRRQLNNGRADRAFELLVKRGPEMLPLYLDQIGWELLARRLSKYLYTHLSALAEDPVVLRWRLALGIELSSYAELIPRAEQVLARRDDPELRAYLGYALHLQTHPASMEHLKRAVRTRQTVLTLVLYSYILQAGRFEESLNVLQATLTKAEAENLACLQVQIRSGPNLAAKIAMPHSPSVKGMIATVCTPISSKATVARGSAFTSETVFLASG